MDVFQVYHDTGRTGLLVALSRLPSDELKAICKEYYLDPTGKYRRQQDGQKLVEFITYRVKRISEKGSVFR